MPKQYYIKELNQAVVIHDTPFASGGEGEVYHILQPTALKNCVAKIFHPNKIDEDKRKKINYLIQNAPVFEGSANDQPIVWVKHALHNANGDFVGFLMPKATGEKLEILTAPKLPKYLGKEWNRFRLGGDDALRLRLKVCYNLAAALRTIHATGKYVLVDLKPDNVLIKSNGVVSIVDMDSIEVIEDGRTLFPATVATPEYTPAEYYSGTKPGKKVMHPSWDNFSLAVIYYRMLFGVHPYAATSKAPYDNINALGDKIKHGLFVHNPDLSNDFVVVPPPHREFGKLDPQLRKLFLKAFVDGFERPEERPAAEEWGQALMNNPLLLTNRPLPSKSLNLDAINEKNWYVMALEKALKEQNLLPIARQTKAAIKNSLGSTYSSALFLQEVKGYYGLAWQWVKKAGRFLGIVFAIVILLFIAATWFAGEPFSDVVFAINMMFQVLAFIPANIYHIGGFKLLFLIGFLPFLIATFRQFTGQAKDKTQNVRKSLIGTFSFTETQKQKSLEELQYTLYNQRTKVKQRLREIKNELIVWTDIKNKKENEFFQKNSKKIQESNRMISSQIRAERLAIRKQDERAKELMVEEANTMKKLRLDLQKLLEEHPVYAAIQGKTVRQKIAFLESQANAENAPINAPNKHEVKAELEALEQELKDNLEALRAEYDEKHNQLLGDANEYKIRIDDLVGDSVDSMRRRTRIDANLINGGFKRLLKSIQNLQTEIDAKELELESINDDIKQLKDELKHYK